MIVRALFAVRRCGGVRPFLSVSFRYRKVKVVQDKERRETEPQSAHMPSFVVVEHVLCSIFGGEWATSQWGSKSEAKGERENDWKTENRQRERRQREYDWTEEKSRSWRSTLAVRGPRRERPMAMSVGLGSRRRASHSPLLLSLVARTVNEGNRVKREIHFECNARRE